MNKFQKILIAAVVVLGIINIALISVVWVQQSRRSHHGPLPPKAPREPKMIREKLGLNLEQARMFRELNTEHRGEMRRLNAQIRQSKRQLHRDVLMGDSIEIQKTMSQLSELHTEVEHRTVKFLKELKQQASKEQQDKLLEMLDESVPVAPHAPDDGSK